MSAEKVEFKFPDEQSNETHPLQETTEELKIEIVDDTPEQDRGRKPLPKELVKELDEDDLEEYSEKVKKRLGQMKKVWHDERREKEKATREREEAIRFAQAQAEENKRLKQRMGAGEKLFIDQAHKAASTELTAARERLKQANESGDPEKLAEAQEKLTEAMIQTREVSRFRPTLQDDSTGVESNQQVQVPRTVVKPDSKAKAWQDKNTWFGTDEEMTALALGLHEKLVRSGVDPSSDDYYDKVNTTMRKRFPEYFVEEQTETQEKEEKPAPRARPATVVAPATRTTAPRQVKLTPTAVALAKRLGLSNEQYAREVMKLENNNG